jgi:hypothetical protein
MAWKVDKAANFVFVQLTEQEQDKIDLAWERISHETKESSTTSRSRV